MSLVARRHISHSIATNYTIFSRLYSFPIECLHNYLSCPWWIGISAMSASVQFLCTYPITRMIPTVRKAELDLLKREKADTHREYLRITKSNDIVLRKNFLYNYQIKRAKFIRSMVAFYFPQVLFVLVYLGGFYVVYKVVQTPSESVVKETSWLVPALTHNYQSNIALDAINGAAFGFFGCLLNRKFCFLPNSLPALAVFSSSVGLFGALSSSLLPGLLKIHCASSLISYLCVFS